MNLRFGKLEESSEIFPRVYEIIKKRSSEPEYPLPVESLNKIAWGYPKGVSVVTARTSHGKTAFMLQSALSLAYSGKNVIFLSLEDTKESLIEKSICSVHKINNQHLKRAEIERINYDKTLETFAQCNLYFDDGYGFNFPEIESVYNQAIFKNGKKADIIFWDYVQMIDDAGFETYGDIMRKLRLWSLKAEIAFVIGSQQNRQSVTMNGAPSNAGVKGSGVIEEVAEMIILLYYPYQLGRIDGKYVEDPDYLMMSPDSQELVQKTYMEISISKNKTGATFSKMPVEYYGKFYFFQDWSTSGNIVKNYRLSCE